MMYDVVVVAMRSYSGPSPPFPPPSYPPTTYESLDSERIFCCRTVLRKSESGEGRWHVCMTFRPFRIVIYRNESKKPRETKIRKKIQRSEQSSRQVMAMRTMRVAMGTVIPEQNLTSDLEDKNG